MISRKQPEKKVIKTAFRNKILSYSCCEHETQILQSILDYLPVVITTLSPLNSTAGILERREAFLAFLFYFDPRLLRVASVLEYCSIKSIEDNQANIINYFVGSKYKLNYSEAITFYESILDGFYVNGGTIFTSIEGKTAIVIDNRSQKDKVIDYINKYWKYLLMEKPKIIPKINKKIMSKALVDFLIFDGFSVKAICGIANDIFSEETGLDDKIKISFTEFDVRSQKTYLKKDLENDSFYPVYKYLEANIYNDPKKLCEALSSRPFVLRFDDKNKKFHI